MYLAETVVYTLTLCTVQNIVVFLTAFSIRVSLLSSANIRFERSETRVQVYRQIY